MPSESRISPGQHFYSDLRLIREKNGLTPEDVFRATKLPLEFVELFETTGLLDHPHYNRVYLRSFVKVYAQIIGIDEKPALMALEEAWKAEYDGSLAVEYLGYTKPPVPERSSTPKPEPEDASVRDEDVEPDQANVVATRRAGREPDDAITPIWPLQSRLRVPQLSVSFRNLPNWVKRTGFWIVLASVSIALIYLGILMVGSGGPEEPASNGDSTVADTAATTVSIPQPLLRDTMAVSIIAANGKLEPVRVAVDGSEEVSYWVEEGDTLELVATDSVVIRAYIDRVALVVDGHTLPTDRRDQRNRLVYTREDILTYLRRMQPGNTGP